MICSRKPFFNIICKVLCLRRVCRLSSVVWLDVCLPGQSLNSTQMTNGCFFCCLLLICFILLYLKCVFKRSATYTASDHLHDQSICVSLMAFKNMGYLLLPLLLFVCLFPIQPGPQKNVKIGLFGIIVTAISCTSRLLADQCANSAIKVRSRILYCSRSFVIT